MLAYYPPRQHMHHHFAHPNFDTSTSLSQTQFYDTIAQQHYNSSTNDLSNRLLEACYAQAPAIENTVHDSGANQYMSSAYDLQNPAIRIQQSTPVPQYPSTYAHTSYVPDANVQQHYWNMYNASSRQMATEPTLQTPSRKARNHQRAPSTSSIASSNSSASQYSHSHGYTHESERSPPHPKVESLKGADEASRAFSNHLPTPSHTPTQDSFLANYRQRLQNCNMESPQSSLRHEAAADEDVPAFTPSGKDSVSSYGQTSPSTPHTTQGDEYDDRFKVPSTGEITSSSVEAWISDYLLFDDDADMTRQSMPIKLDRTMSDIYQDELYNPANAAALAVQAPSRPINANLLTPYRNTMVHNRLQAADAARSQSPASAISREVSPFRFGSQHDPGHAPSPRPRLATASQAREQQKAEADAYAARQLSEPLPEEPPKTISPKEAMLDYQETEEDAKMPLFPDGGSSEYGQQYNGGNNISHYDNSSEASYGHVATAQNGTWQAPQQTSPAFSNASVPQSNFTFATPSLPMTLPFDNSQYRPVTNLSSGPEPTPEFPAHLTSMESSASEAPDSNPSSQQEAPMQKPAGATADSGTYTCTYHGCSLRFETPQKLQKHKRDGHRQTVQPTPITPGIGSGMTSAALMARNSQAGPHKCERINPTTGKPCNTIFSRPYDLTRHEDTIHNNRKQKVRCALCVEEKTFSRNDALTRHMRVVHPEVDFPGKNRRRGGSEH
ncbi:hypothetical protein H2199_004805 [Coniosporium tulheliwenetii]|uniref:Uncharacterized protein n=1 Tax=Coniosporium tulheliwenetii TaxID=3383036 RepID=A0ACC2Z516_9PEZI|nr:hypothetical protein H2199_004805 [Cladosporium sp. JES 115]